MRWYRRLTWVLTGGMFILSMGIYTYYSEEIGFSLFAAFLTAALTAASMIIIGWFIESLISRS